MKRHAKRPGRKERTRAGAIGGGAILMVAGLTRHAAPIALSVIGIPIAFAIRTAFESRQPWGYVDGCLLVLSVLLVFVDFGCLYVWAARAEKAGKAVATGGSFGAFSFRAQSFGMLKIHAVCCTWLFAILVALRAAAPHLAHPI